MRSLIDALVVAKDRINVTWVLGVAELSKPAAKVLLNFAQIAIEALARGGEIDIAAEVRDGTSEIAVRAIREELIETGIPAELLPTRDQAACSG